MHATVQISHGGRIVLPARMRQAMLVADGSRMVASLDVATRTLQLVPVDEALDALQARAAVWLAGTGSLADELIVERRAEAAAEAADE